MKGDEQCRLILSWIISDDFAKNALFDSEVISEDMLSKFPNLPTSLLDKNVNLALIEKFCVGNSFNKIKEMIQMKKENPTWKCGTCKKSLRRSRNIICEHCLPWSHFTCSKPKEKPAGNWFSMKCRGMFREGNTLD